MRRRLAGQHALLPARDGGGLRRGSLERLVLPLRQLMLLRRMHRGPGSAMLGLELLDGLLLVERTSLERGNGGGMGCVVRPSRLRLADKGLNLLAAVLFLQVLQRQRNLGRRHTKREPVSAAVGTLPAFNAS